MIGPYAKTMSYFGLHMTEIELSLRAGEGNTVRFTASGFYDERELDDMDNMVQLISAAWYDPQCRDLLEQCKVILALKNDQ